MDLLPNLELVANFGVGYDSVDAAEAARRGVIVTNTPGVLDADVADTAIALLIMTIRRLPQAERHLRSGAWEHSAFPLTPTTIGGRRVGIVGLGRVGAAIASRLEPFGVEIVYHSRSPRAGVAYRHFASLLDMAEYVDTLVVAVPGGPTTQRLVNKQVLEALGPDGILVNVARGSVIDEAALIDVLKSGIILGAGLDVFEEEPYVPPQLVERDDVVLLPHVGSATEPTRKAMAELVVANLMSWFTDGTVVTPVPESQHLVPGGQTR